MASTAHPPANFQLFPPPLPKLKINSTTNHRAVKSGGLAVTPGIDAVVIQVTSEPIAGAAVEQTQATSQRPLSFQLASEQEVLNLSPADGVNAARNPSPVPQSVRSASATLVRSNSAISPTTPVSPFVQMRSIFPTYNHTLPLSQQPYYPQRATNVQGQVLSREEYGPKSISPRKSDFDIGGPRTAPASMVDFPLDGLAFREQQFSSPRELGVLWEATSGQEPDLLHGAFDLQMSRLDVATFNFGCTPTAPFYTLQTYSTNEISVSRTHPRNQNCNIPLLLLALEDRSRRQPPNDGLVTYIFPQLAAKLAKDQSAELAILHGLAPTHRDEMETDALRRAEAQEACHLTWNETGRRYQLAHPAIGRNSRTPDFSISPTSPRPTEMGVLHINVSSSPMNSATSPPVILVTNPNHTSGIQNSMPPHPRMSNLPLLDNSEPLASLDLGSMTLHIAAKSILQLMPSLYAIDSIVSAIFAVAVADEATNPILADMNIWTPMPRAPPSVYGGSVGGRIYQGSVLYTTIAEREEAEQARSKREKANSSKSFWTRKAKAEKIKQPKQIVIGEIDIEKLGTYQKGNRKGQKLPAVTRSALSIMVMALKIMVWFLTVLVKFLAWVMVTITRAVTSEKF